HEQGRQAIKRDGLGVVLHVNRRVHGRRSTVSSFVGINRANVLQGRADVVQTFQQDFLARWCNLERKHQALFVGDRLVRQIHCERKRTICFGSLEDFVDIRVLQDRRQNTVLETVVVKNVGVAWSKDYSETVIANGPWGVFAAGAASEVGPREKNRGALVFREIQNEFGIRFLASEVAPVVEQDSAK